MLSVSKQVPHRLVPPAAWPAPSLYHWRKKRGGDEHPAATQRPAQSAWPNHQQFLYLATPKHNKRVQCPVVALAHQAPEIP